MRERALCVACLRLASLRAAAACGGAPRALLHVVEAPPPRRSLAELTALD